MDHALATMTSLGTLPPYQYRCLESASFIRILVLHPADDPYAPLEVELVHANRDDMINGNDTTSHYEAVSYCWGDAIFLHGLVCDRTSKIRITSNVDAMLRQFRKPNRHRYLWIDAICLNQQDVEEKDVQIPRMGEIYQRATKVDVWLGEATKDDGISAVFGALKAQFIQTQYPPKATVRSEQKLTQGSQLFNTSMEIFLKRLLSRPWFGRRWILQEVAFGQHITVYCGSWKLNWNWFLGGISALASTETWAMEAELKRNLARVSRTMRAIRASPGKSNLVDLLWKFRTSQCSVPEDKIFAILGIAEDAHKFSRVGSSFHWSKVYTLVAIILFATHPNVMFEHLICFGSLSQEFPACPSWVPNWNAPGISDYLFKRMDKRERRVDSGTKLRFATRVQGKGLTFSTNYVADIEVFGQSSQSLLAKIRAGSTQNSLDSLTRLFFARVFVASIRVDRSLSNICKPDLEEHQLVRAVDDALEHIFEEHVRPPTELEKTMILVLERVAQNYIIFTFHGKERPGETGLGIGPANTQVGDVMIALPGDPANHMYGLKAQASLGLMIRPHRGMEDSYVQGQLVGLCFYSFKSYNIKLDMHVVVKLF